LTPRQRLLAVLRREKPDTVPIYVRGVSPFGEKMNWMGRHHPSYERLRKYVFENADILHGTGFDSGVFLSAADARARESVIREDADWRDVEWRVETPRGPIRNVTRRSKQNLYEVMEVEYFIKSEEDYERFMSIPYVPPRPEVKPRMAEKDREVGEHGLPMVEMPCALSVAHQLLGSEGLAMWSVFHRDRVMKILTTMRDRTLDYMEYVLSEGAGPLFGYGGPELAVPPLLSPQDFHDFVTEIDRPVHELVHSRGCYTVIHCHGKLSKVLEDFVEIGVDVLEPVEAPPGGDVALDDVKRRIGDKVVLMGNMPYEAIISWTPGRIAERVKADCEAAMAGGGYVMMPAASPFEPVLTDEGFEGFKAYIQAGRKYGRY